MPKTIGIVVVAALAASAADVLIGVAMTDTRRLTRSAANSGKSFIIVVPPAVFDRHILALEIATLAQAFAECRHEIVRSAPANHD